MASLEAETLTQHIMAQANELWVALNSDRDNIETGQSKIINPLVPSAMILKAMDILKKLSVGKAVSEKEYSWIGFATSDTYNFRDLIRGPEDTLHKIAGADKVYPLAVALDQLLNQQKHSRNEASPPS